jgi:gephyrin
VLFVMVSGFVSLRCNGQMAGNEYIRTLYVAGSMLQNTSKPRVCHPTKTTMETPISVEEAIKRVLLNTHVLQVESLPLSPDLLGRIAAADVVARENFPPFAASIMDGYAVVGPLQPGAYPIVENIHAGAVPQVPLQSGSVAYITTGAALPAGANAVVKVEDTERTSGSAPEVKIKVAVEAGTFVRQIGSDIAEGEVVIRRGQLLGPYELGLLATTGFPLVQVYRKPVIGVMSTGNELVEASATPTGSQVRDSNRLSLIAACFDRNQEVIDLGIASDSKEELRQRLLDAAARCDVVITSGGVSMGAADFVKPLLRELGTIHFAKINMKPGKPTTFATFDHPSDGGANASKRTLFFGLPGNPVSCLVTKALFVDTAVKRLQGFDSEQCLHPQLTVVLAGNNIKLDPERPEYHRAILLNVDDKSGAVHAYSTGNQRSSRLLSMLSANALLFLPQGPGVIEVGAQVQALLIRPLTAAPRTLSVHPSAALVDFADAEEVGDNSRASSPTQTTTQSGDYVSFPRKAEGTASAPSTSTAKSIVAGAQGAHVTSCVEGDTMGDQKDWRNIRVGLLTISDRVRKHHDQDCCHLLNAAGVSILVLTGVPGSIRGCQRT